MADNQFKAASADNTFDQFMDTLPKEEHAAANKMFNDVLRNREDAVIEKCKPSAISIGKDIAKGSYDYWTKGSNTGSALDHNFGKSTSPSHILDRIIQRHDRCVKNEVGPEAIQLYRAEKSTKH